VSPNRIVMPGRVPGIYAFFYFGKSGVKDVDGRIKSGHDDFGFGGRS
jgi:hypothetical protein